MQHTRTLRTWLLSAVAAGVFSPAMADDSAPPATDGPTDYSVCDACDLRSQEDEEVAGFIDLIAESRWQLNKIDHGRVIIQDKSGDKATWRWQSKEGALESMTLVDSE